MKLSSRVRWRAAAPEELDEVLERLRSWPCPPGGEVRHQFPLATIETRGVEPVRVADSDRGWAACVVTTASLLVPCGDPEVIAAAGIPQRRWRLTVGDSAAVDALLMDLRQQSTAVVLVQRFQTVDPERVPSESELPDPGLRQAVPEDVDGLAELAVQLHLDDGYGPHPGRAGLRAYRRRMEASIHEGSVFCVGKPGEPVLKVELSVDSPRYGVQLSGIVARPDVRGQGLGEATVAAAVRRSLARRPGRAITLHVRADNDRALHVYANVGFVDREEWRLAVHN